VATRFLLCVCVFTTLASAQSNNFNVPAGRVNASPVEMKADPCFHQELDNGRARVFLVEVAPHASTGLDTHRQD
jgi:hypothetical protein